MPIRAKSTRVLFWWRNDVLEYFLSLCEKASLHFSYWSRKLQQIMTRLLPHLIFPGNWANALGFCFLNVTTLKVAERWKLSIMHFSFISKLQGLGPHYTAPMLTNGCPHCLTSSPVYQPRVASEGQMDTLVVKASILPSFFATFIYVTTCN